MAREWEESREKDTAVDKNRDTLMGGDEKFIISSLSLKSCFMLFLGRRQDV